MTPAETTAVRDGRETAFASAWRSRLSPASGSPAVAAAWYTLAAVAMTWPLSAHLATRVVHDLGDPMEVCWILWWSADRFLQLCTGHLDALHRFWNGNIFYPHPLTLAYAEHLIPQAIEIFPIYAATRNLVLCYNLLFLSTFVLSGVGMFLFVRELTGSPRAAFLAGLFYAFTPYRLTQLGHLQVLSSQWMPFALFGMRRFFAARSRAVLARAAVGGSEADTPKPTPLAGAWPLAGAMLAFVVQNLSCLYFLVYFAPFLLAYALWEIAVRKLWRDAGTWALLVAGAAAAGAATLPFLLPYLSIRTLGFGPRPLDEVMAFSADTFSYLLASDALWLYPGGFTKVGRPEGALFPGFTPLAFGAVAVAGLAVGLWRRARVEPPLRGWRMVLAVPIVLVAAWALDLARFLLFGGRFVVRLRDTWEPLGLVGNMFTVAGVCLALLVVLSRRARAAARAACTSTRGFFACALVAAVWLSLGPHVTSASFGVSGDTVYVWLYRYVPGFSGVRVPSRLAMLAAMFLAVLGGYGAAWIAGDRAGQGGGARRGWRDALLVGAGLFFLLESTIAPFKTTDVAWQRRDYAAGMVSFDDLRPLYGYLRGLPPSAVILELPFCDLEGETRAMVFSTLHRHPIVNGYSGNFPDSYNNLCDVLENPIAHSYPAWFGLLKSRATHLVVHQWAYRGYAGRDLSRWLIDHGARPVATFKEDRVFEMPSAGWPPAQ